MVGLSVFPSGDKPPISFKGQTARPGAPTRQAWLFGFVCGCLFWIVVGALYTLAMAPTQRRLEDLAIREGLATRDPNLGGAWRWRTDRERFEGDVEEISVDGILDAAWGKQTGEAKQ